METGSSDRWAFQSSTWLRPQAADRDALLLWTPRSETRNGCVQLWIVQKGQTKERLVFIVLLRFSFREGN